MYNKPFRSSLPNTTIILVYNYYVKTKIKNSINYMKKIITICLLTVLLVLTSFVFETKVEAQIDDTCPSIAPYRCNNGSCTNEASLCDQSWGGGLNTDPGGTTTGGTTTVTPPST